jgi:uncharacterized protein (DUF58 family)
MAISAPVWLLTGTIWGVTLATVVTVVLLALPVIDALSIPRPTHLLVSRTFKPMLGVGDHGEGTYEIRSHAKRRVRFKLTQNLPNAINAKLPDATYTLDPDTSITIPLQIEGRTRGTHPLGKIALTIFGNTELTKKNVIYNLDDTITIIPSITANRRFRLFAIQRQMRAAGERALRRRGQGKAFANLRDYVIGDDPRTIDWKATARRNRLISREYTLEQGQTVLLAIDAGRMMTQMAGDRTRFEYALASALTLADVAIATGDRVGLLVFNETVQRYIPPTRGAAALNQMRDALTNVTVTLAEPDYAAAFRTVAERQSRRSLIVLFTDVIDMRSSRAIVANTTRAAMRHLPLVIALRNEQLTAAAIPNTDGDDRAVYGAIAAEELLSARDEVLQNMRQAGVSVIDTPPTMMTAAVINRYLDIKNRSLL